MVLVSPTTILFDLDGTLRHNQPDGAATFRAFAQERGFSFSQAQADQADRWTHRYFADSEELKLDRVRSEGEEGRFWLLYARRYLEALGASDGDLDDLAERINQRMRDEYQPVDTVHPDVLPTLDQLRDRGVRLGVVTNRSQPVDELIRSLGMSQVFDLVLTAGQAGVWKPDPEIFRIALRTLEAESARTVFVGDNYYSDIQGARGAGLQPILFDPRGLFLNPGCPVVESIEQVTSVLFEDPFRDSPP